MIEPIRWDEVRYIGVIMFAEADAEASVNELLCQLRTFPEPMDDITRIGIRHGKGLSDIQEL